MDLRSFNNFFGDMDLMLMDLILKGRVPKKGRVLDVGCGEGRNAIYFLQNGYEYHGWDIDASKLKLVGYLAEKIAIGDLFFQQRDLRDSVGTDTPYDLIICSRMLHFANSDDDLQLMWNNLSALLTIDGILYGSMDSVIDTSIGKHQQDGTVFFPDGSRSYALTPERYTYMKRGFSEIEPLKTLVHYGTRAQSFFALEKTGTTHSSVQ